MGLCVKYPIATIVVCFGPPANRVDYRPVEGASHPVPIAPAGSDAWADAGVGGYAGRHPSECGGQWGERGRSLPVRLGAP